MNLQQTLDELQREQQRVQSDLNKSSDVAKMSDLTKELAILTSTIANLNRLRNHREKLRVKEMNKN